MLNYRFLRLFSLNLAQRRGFEPPVGFRPTHDFQSCSLNHSDISAFYEASLAEAFLYYMISQKNASVFSLFFQFFLENL